MSLAVHEPLPGDDARAVLGEPALRGELLQHGGVGLLDLQEQRRAALIEQQHDPGRGPHASDADDLAGEMCDAVLVEQVPAVRLERAAVGAQDLVEGARDRLGVDVLGQVLDRHDQRRIVDDARFAAGGVAELLERLQAVV